MIMEKQTVGAPMRGRPRGGIDLNQYERKIGQAAIRTFGRIPNIIKAIEELSELQQALCKHIVSENDAMTVASVHEEMADVEIMLEQLRIILGNHARVDAWQHEKLARLAVRLERAK